MPKPPLYSTEPAGPARRAYTLGRDHMTTGTRQGNGILSWQQRADMLKRLVDAGYVRKLFLSND